jgi:hypothetical protein
MREPSAVSRTRFHRFGVALLAYVLSPKVLLEGVLVFAATQAIDAYTICRNESRDDVKAATVDVSKLIAEMPPDLCGRFENLR